jgi:hypothetical protein
MPDGAGVRLLPTGVKEAEYCADFDVEEDVVGSPNATHRLTRINELRLRALSCYLSSVVSESRAN